MDAGTFRQATLSANYSEAMRTFPGSRHIYPFIQKTLCLCLVIAALLAVRPSESFAAGKEMTRILQERSRVESNLIGLKKQLEEYQLKLSKTKKDEASSMKALNNIRTQILVYQRLIGENQTYLNSLNSQIDALHQELDVNRQNYGRVSSDFQRLAVAAYKRGGDRDAETIFASGSMNDALLRARYMGFLSQSVRFKVNDLESSAQRIQSAQAQLQESYRQKQSALKAQQEQLKDYASRQKEKETVLSSIKEDRKTYLTRITEVRRKQREMQSRIESLIMAQQAVIQKEQERARQAALQRQRIQQARLAEARRLESIRQEKTAAALRARQLAARLSRQRQVEPRSTDVHQVTMPRLKEPAVRQQPPTKPLPAVTTLEPKTEPVANVEPKSEPVARTEPVPSAEPVKPLPREEPPKLVPDIEETEIAKVSADFDSAVRHLPWPVVNGVVVRHFGSFKDKDLNIVTTSNGIDISVPVNSPVKAISGGKVAQIAYLPTFGNVVIIRHPKSYLTVYANLVRVSVAKGEVIKSGHSLGASAAMSEGGSVVHFEIWKGKLKQNPEKWLR